MRPGGKYFFGEFHTKMSLVDFLRRAKENSNAIMVVGNESADLDSVCSAIVVAHSLSQSGTKFYCPLINTTKELLELRGEVVAVLERFGISTSDLTYYTPELVNTKQVILVDHNEITKRWIKDNVRCEVIAIYDHHADSGQLLELNDRFIMTCASNASVLVSRKIIDEMLWFPLVWDSMCFTFRTTPLDMEAKNILKGDSLDENETWSMLVESSKSVDEATLGPTLLLQKDLKVFQTNELTYVIPTIHISIKEEHLEALKVVASAHQASFGFICSAYLDGQTEHSFAQELLIWHRRHDEVVYFLSKNGIQLNKLRCNQYYSVCQVLNKNFGRKQLQPLLHAFLSQK